MKNDRLLRKELRLLIKKLMSFEPTAHNPEGLEKAFLFVKNYCKDQTLFVKDFESKGKKCMMVSFGKNKKKPSVILNAHLDVVHAGKDKFVLKVDGDKLIGRGTADMLGPLSVVIKLFADLAKEQKYSDCSLMIVSDEETGGHHGTKYLRDKGYKPKFFLACEPSDEEIINEAKGILWLKLTTTGSQGHASRPWLYPNPINAMIKELRNYPKLIKDDYAKNDWSTTYSITSFQAGKDINQIPDTASLILDIRFIPGDNPQEIIDELSNNPRWKVEVLMNESPMYCDANNQYLTRLQQASATPLRIERRPGASDARFYTEIGVNSIFFGPIGGGYHATDEWVSQKSLLEYYHTLKNFLLTV